MWTNEYIQKAADGWLSQCKELGKLSPSTLALVKTAYIKGCEHLINNTQKQ